MPRVGAGSNVLPASITPTARTVANSAAYAFTKQINASTAKYAAAYTKQAAAASARTSSGTFYLAAHILISYDRRGTDLYGKMALILSATPLYLSRRLGRNAEKGTPQATRKRYIASVKHYLLVVRRGVGRRAGVLGGQAAGITINKKNSRGCYYFISPAGIHGAGLPVEHGAVIMQ